MDGVSRDIYRERAELSKSLCLSYDRVRAQLWSQSTDVGLVAFAPSAAPSVAVVIRSWREQRGAAAAMRPSTCSDARWMLGLREECSDLIEARRGCCAAPPAPRRAVHVRDLPGRGESRRRPRLAATTRPMWRMRHSPSSDAVFGLATAYDVDLYKVFVGSLRKSGFAGDVVLATSVEHDMLPGVSSSQKAASLALRAGGTRRLSFVRCLSGALSGRERASGRERERAFKGA